jgi:hypothetical protein
MNTLELYKNLPKKNCGKCRQKNCMPFALSIIKGEAELSECPYLRREEIETLKGSVTKSDWREELILSLKEEIKNINFKDIADGIGAELKNSSPSIKCLGREFTVEQNGEVSTHEHITPWMKILLLHYVRTAGKGNLSGKLVSYSELKAGLIKASAFQRDCEEPLKELFDADMNMVVSALGRLGAESRKGFPTEYAWHIYLLPKIPVVILYWPNDEEFPSKVKILFDSTADRFLDTESLIFLVEGLVKNIQMIKLPFC